MTLSTNDQSATSQYAEAKRIHPFTDFPTKGFYLIKELFKTEKDTTPITAAIVEWNPTESYKWIDPQEVKYLTLDYLFEPHCIKPNISMAELVGLIIQVKATFKTITVEKTEAVINWTLINKNANPVNPIYTDILTETTDDQNVLGYYDQEFDKHEIELLAEELENDAIDECLDFDGEQDKQLINDQLDEIESGLFNDAALIAWQAAGVDQGYYDDNSLIEMQLMETLEERKSDDDKDTTGQDLETIS